MLLSILERNYGAAEIACLESTNIQAVKTLVEKEPIECEFPLCRTLDVFIAEFLPKVPKTHMILCESQDKRAFMMCI